MNRERIIMPHQETLCWRCANAVPDREGERGCTWSREGKPVEGWKAVRRDIRAGNTADGKKTESYRVRKCPQFRRDPAKRRAETPLEHYRQRLEQEANPNVVMLEAAMDPRVSEGDFMALLTLRRQTETQKEENR